MVEVLFREKKEYLKIRKNERKKQKAGISNSNLGSCPAKIINLGALKNKESFKVFDPHMEEVFKSS